jgi:hypothetical protein
LKGEIIVTLGIAGTGPFGRISDLRREISDANYELENFVSKSPRSMVRKRLEKQIKDHRAEIRAILRREKEKKA